MQNIIKNIAAGFLLLIMAAACKKEGKQYFIEEGSFAPNSLSASSTNIVLLAANENATAVSFAWTGANFGEKPVIKYTLQLAKIADTSGANAWANAKTFEAGNNTGSYNFLVKDINGTINVMGYPAGVATDLAVRLKAEVPQYNGTTSTIPPVYSNTVVVKITGYSLSLWIPGEHQGWNPAAAPLLNPVAGRPGMYEGYIFMSGGAGTKYFKYTSAPDWNHINYGDGGNGTFSTDGAAGGLNVPSGGYYEVTADFNTNKWTATKTDWGIIGDATPGGWGGDTPMSYDPATQVWTVTCNMVANGSFKFRANGAWNIDFGIDGSGKLVYADNPFLGYTPNLNNLSVPTTGNYTITLDLHDSQHYTYILHRN
ncbi:MAG: hypothetical protein EOP51_26410 [Sphingobacteriales bacterium]|nr:MAG: hypothetical protein EOP51_26410 [Sphingobacteriales bacterium]